MFKRFSLVMTTCINGLSPFCPGEDSVPAGGEERSGEPEERPRQKNKDVRIRPEAGKVRNDVGRVVPLIMS